MSESRFVNKEGQTVPSVSFPVREGEVWVSKHSDDIFKGRTVVVFSLPGAFTPTCSSTHLPRYNALAKVFKKYGVDEIVCVSVNDTFVMNAWGADQEAENITLLPEWGARPPVSTREGGAEGRTAGRSGSAGIALLYVAGSPTARDDRRFFSCTMS